MDYLGKSQHAKATPLFFKANTVLKSYKFKATTGVRYQQKMRNQRLIANLPNIPLVTNNGAARAGHSDLTS